MNTIVIRTSWRLAALSAFAVVVSLGGSVLRSQAQNSPEGTWDLVLSGSQRGVAQITFLPDQTLFGLEIVTDKPRSSSAGGSANPRGGEEDGSREENGTSGSSTNLGSSIYGRVGLSGIWTFDNRLRIIGLMIEDGGTNHFTNGLSFRAVVRPGAITMTAVREGRSITYRGVPLQPLPDLSGNYYGIGKKAGLPFTELFTLAPGSLMNEYNVGGVGPNYFFTGSVMVSAKKQFAFFSKIGDPTNSLLRSLAGSFRPSNSTASLKGVAENADGDDSNVNLKVAKQP
jgi:hypothetical protein